MDAETDALVDDLDALLAGAKLLLVALDHVEAQAAVNWCEHGELRNQCAACGGDAYLDRDINRR